MDRTVNINSPGTGPGHRQHRFHLDLLIGMNLIAEGLGFHIPKGYTYFAMAFALFVEMLNLRMRSRKPVPRALQSRRLQKAIHRIEAPH